MNREGWPARGAVRPGGERGAGCGNPSGADASALAERLLAKFSDPAYTPPVLPGVALEIAELARRPDVPLKRVVEVLECDPLLAAGVLRRARAALYAGRTPPRSLKDAVMRLGLVSLRNTVFEVALEQRVFHGAGAYGRTMERLRRHSTVSAWFARLLCRYTSQDGEFSFLVALLHDVGIAGLLLALADEPRRGAAPAFEQAWPAIDAIHARASADLARLWGLADEVRDALARHHPERTGGALDGVSATLCIADALADEMGAAIVPPPRAAGAPDGGGEEAPLLPEAIDVLGLHDRTMALIRAEARTLVSQIR